MIAGTAAMSSPFPSRPILARSARMGDAVTITYSQRGVVKSPFFPP